MEQPEIPDPASIFLNVPYDETYSPVFDAILFAIVACGFTPRSAFDTGSSDELRLTRIKRSLFGSRYSIHDLTRCTGEGAENLARFNMPLELGMAMACGILGPQQPKHEWLVLVPRGYKYAQFISDLSGFDPAEYDGSPKDAIAQVVAWMWTRKSLASSPNPQQVLTALPNFMEALKKLREEWEPTAPPWSELVQTALANRPVFGDAQSKISTL